MKQLNFTFILALSVLLISCNDSSTSQPVNTRGNSSPFTNNFQPSTPGSGSGGTPIGGGGSNSGGGSSSGGGCSYGSANASGVADNGQVQEYYKINNPHVVAHGAGEGQVVWSSDTDLPAQYNQNIFYTNSRFNVRVIPKIQDMGTDTRGVACNYTGLPFEKMQIGVLIRTSSMPSGTGEYHLFENVKRDCPSKVKEFQVPQNTNEPLIVEVLNVQWDYGCLYYKSQGYENVAGFCPYGNVWPNDCYKLEIQFATDSTKDLPGTRVN